MYGLMTFKKVGNSKLCINDWGFLSTILVNSQNKKQLWEKNTSQFKNPASLGPREGYQSQLIFWVDQHFFPRGV